MRGTINRRELLIAASGASSCRSARDQTIRLGSVNPDTMQQLPVVAADQLGVSVPQSAIDAFNFKGTYNPMPDAQRTLPNVSILGFLGLGRRDLTTG